MMKGLRIVLFVVSCFWGISLKANQEKHVLHINSYNSNFPTFHQQISGLRSVFDSIGVCFDVECMDSKRFVDSLNLGLFKAQLQHKLKSSGAYDLIIVSDDNAFDFALTNQQELFLGIPIIFFGINNIEKALDQNNAKNITGVVEAVSMLETIEQMQKLFPRKKSLYAISDASVTGQNDLKKFNLIAEKFPEWQFNVIDLSQLSFNEYADSLKKIDSETPVLLLSAFCDKNKETIHFKRSIRILKTHLKAPLFHLWEHGIGKGILGGQVISHFNQAKQAASIALDVLNGRNIESIKVIDDSPNIIMYDDNELNRFNINRNLLPDSVRIINFSESFWVKNKKIIIVTAVVFIVLLGFVFVLLVSVFKRQRIANELIKAKNRAEESDRLKTEFIQNLSHEVRTPMNGILGFTDLLINNELDIDSRKEYLEVIRSCGRSLLHIIDDILEISRLDAHKSEAKMSTFDLNELLTELHSIFKLKDNNEEVALLLKLCSENENYVNTDINRLQKILSNLLENALKYTDRGMVELGCYSDENNNFIYVKDTGIGIPSDMQETIFQRFYQVKENGGLTRSGLGLGLAIVQENADLIGAQINVCSEKQKGSCFTLILPKQSV